MENLAVVFNLFLSEGALNLFPFNIMFLEVGSAFIVFFVLAGFSLVPYCLLKHNVNRSPAKSATSNYLLSLCNCFACGIFLSTCFLGLLPHVQHHEEVIRQNIRGDGHNGTMPEITGWKAVVLDSNLVVLCGFLLILFMEQLIFCCSNEGESSADTASYHQHRNVKDSTNKFFSLDGDVGEPLVDTSFGDESDEEGKIEFRMIESVDEHFHAPHDHGHHHHHVLPAGGLSIRSFFLLIGLSIHSIFEGVALGVQGEIKDFISVLVAIMVHEVLCSLAYGVSLAQQHAAPRSAIISIALLSACIPFGMCSAFMIQTLDSATALGFRFALEGLAAGTFVYVSCVEMLSAEIGGHDKKGVVKAVCVSAGVFVFLGIRLLMQGGAHGH
uniref:Zinc transporter ZIP3 n=1 Tax=Steinernema glaseri TaxID=37863 RepID=A0A1I7YQZ2_9BILA